MSGRWHQRKCAGWIERTDDSILQELDIICESPGHVRKRKRSYFGHLCRARGCQITKTSRRVRGWKDIADAGGHANGRPMTCYMDNIKQWPQITISQCVRAAEARSRWKEIVMLANNQT